MIGRRLYLANFALGACFKVTVDRVSEYNPVFFLLTTSTGCLLHTYVARNVRSSMCMK